MPATNAHLAIGRMNDIRYYEVRRVPPAALNYVIWRAMSEGRFEPSEEMKAGAEEFAKLDQTDIEALGVLPLVGAPMCTGPGLPARSLAQPSPLKYATTSALFLLRAMDSALLPREDVHTGSAPCFTSSFTIARLPTPAASSNASDLVAAG